jgi:hypothetical protein
MRSLVQLREHLRQGGSGGLRKLGRVLYAGGPLRPLNGADIVPVAQLSVGVYGITAFLAGFSEAYFLNSIRRLGGFISTRS